MAKVNKQNTDDLFSGLKYVDKLLNEAAGVGNPPKKLSFEDKMKKKLKEGYDEAAELDETQDLEEYNYNYPYTNNAGGAGSPYLGEDHMDDEETRNEFDDEDRFGEDPLAVSHGAGRQAAMSDFERENSIEEPEEEFDFTKDEALMEALMETEPNLDAADDEIVSPANDGAIAAGTEAAPIDATPTDETGDIDMTTDAGLGSADGNPGVDMGADLEGGVDELGAETPEMGADTSIGGSPSMGGGIGAASAAPEPSGIEGAMSPVEGPEDIDQLIADLVAGTGVEETQPAVFGENKETKALGFTDAKDEDVTDKVKTEAKEVKMESKETKAEEAKEKKAEKKEVKEGEIKLTKLGDADITGNVKGATSGEKVVHSGTGKRVDSKGEEFTDLGDDDITGNKVGKGAEKATAPAQPKFSALKKENDEKTKALYTLAEQVITLQDEVANLKFKTFKLEKVNSVLTLLPELKLATREKLVEKFDTCKSYAETKKLYSEVADMVKDHKRGSINEAVAKTQKSSTKYFGESVDETSSTEDREQARRNHLAGVKGFEDGYGVY